MHAQNLKLKLNHKLPTAQKCQHYSLLLLNNTLHLGSCGLSEGACLCRCLQPAPVGLVFLTELNLIYLCGRALPLQHRSSWTPELLTPGPPSPLLFLPPLSSSMRQKL